MFVIMSDVQCLSGRTPDIGLSLPGAQLTRMHPNHKGWLGSLEFTYYWK